MSDSIYDDPDVQPVGGSYVSFDNSGDGVKNVELTALEKGTDYNGNPAVVLVLKKQSGEVVKVTCGQANLKKQINEMRPPVGTFFSEITYAEDVKVPKGTMKRFDVIVGEKPSANAVAAAAADIV